MNEARLEVSDIPRKQQRLIMVHFAEFRHLSRKYQDQFLESIRKYPKLYSIALAIQQDDEQRGWQN